MYFNNFIKNSRDVQKHSIRVTGGLRMRYFGLEQKASQKGNINLDEKKEAALLKMIEQIPPLLRLMNLLLLPFKTHISVKLECLNRSPCFG